MKKCLYASLGALALFVLVIVLWISRVLSDLPDVSALKHYRPAAAAEVLDKDGALLTHYYDRKFRVWVPMAAIPDIVIDAVVTAEDDTFFEHHGVNYKATREAMYHDVQKRRFSRGGSTITQQMIKNVLLSKEKTVARKLREYFLARKAEEILSKRRILEIYLNEVEWGDDLHGIEAASRFYFDKHVSELSIAEAALLAGMLPNPHYYDPFKRPAKARKRQERVLFNMQQAKQITQEDYAAALQEPLKLRQETPGRTGLPAPSGGAARPCYQLALEQVLLSLFGEQDVYRGGRTFRTTLDRNLQNEFGAWEASLPDHTNQPHRDIKVIKQGGLVRALICEKGRDAELDSRIDSLGVPAGEYEVGTMPVVNIAREQILLPADKGPK